jgi:small-conductance mechanosensitive channel
MLKLKEDWKKKTKKERRSAIFWLVFWCVALVYVVIISLSPLLWPGQPITAALAIGAAIPSGWSEVWPRLLGTLYYFSAFIGASMLIRFLLGLIPTGNRKGDTVVKLTQSFIKYSAALVLIFVILAIWGVNSTQILVSAGILALVIGLGAQSLISDIIAGLNIVFEGEFDIGDIVVVDDFRGTIEEIGLTTTKILDPAGNVKIINNSQISTVVNLSKHPSVAICDMAIDYDQDLETVEKLFADNAAAIRAKIPAALDDPKYIGVSEMCDGYINLRIICHCLEGDKFAVQRALNREYLQLFLKNNVDFPYPQLMVGMRESTHPQDVANPEQFQKILAHLAGEVPLEKKNPEDK